MDYALQVKEAMTHLFRMIIFASQKKIISSLVQKIIFVSQKKLLIQRNMKLFLPYKETHLFVGSWIYFCFTKKNVILEVDSVTRIINSLDLGIIFVEQKKILIHCMTIILVSNDYFGFLCIVMNNCASQKKEFLCNIGSA